MILLPPHAGTTEWASMPDFYQTYSEADDLSFPFSYYYYYGEIKCASTMV
jgi:hypothetical protein